MIQRLIDKSCEPFFEALLLALLVVSIVTVREGGQKQGHGGGVSSSLATATKISAGGTFPMWQLKRRLDGALGCPRVEAMPRG